MSLGSITYGTMIEQVKTWIKTNCVNIANYGSIPSCFKSGYSVSGTCAGTFPVSYKDTYTITIAGNVVSEVATSTVDTQMNDFWSSYCGNLNTSLSITPTNYLGFIQDMTSFCSGRVFMAVSEYDSHKYLIYFSGGTTYTNYVSLNSTQLQYRFVTASDIAYNAQGILYNVINSVNQTIRLYPTRYNINIA